VQTGLGENMSMKAYLRYYEQPQRARTLSINNLILSQTKLATHVESPEAVRRTDWANLAYSAAGYNHFAEGITPAYMRLQRYVYFYIKKYSLKNIRYCVFYL